MTKFVRGRQALPGDLPAAVLSYRPQGKTLELFNRCPLFMAICIGPLGSGKTFAAINQILRCCHVQEPDENKIRRSRWCIARNSLPDLLSATIPDVRSIVDLINPDGWNMTSPITWTHNYPRSDGTTVHIELFFRSFDGPRDVKKARGMQLTGIWVDEVGEFNKENFDMLVGRVKRYPPIAEVPNARFRCLATSNSVAKDHWLAKIALAKIKPPNWWVGIQPGGVIKNGSEWVENPVAENRQNLAKNYYRDQLGGKKESWIRQNLANEFVSHSDGRPIHPDFNEVLHARKTTPVPGLPLLLGMDWGRTPACIIGQRMNNGQIVILREICLENAAADKLGARVKTILNKDYAGYVIDEATGDPSGGSGGQQIDDTCFELFTANSGIESFAAETNNPVIRVAALDNLLTQLVDGEPMIIIDEDCHMLVRGLGGEYCYKRIQVTGDERYKDQPDKGPTSHPCEALHYLLMGAGEGDALFENSWGSDDDGLESESTALPDYIYE